MYTKLIICYIMIEYLLATTGLIVNTMPIRCFKAYSAAKRKEFEHNIKIKRGLRRNTLTETIIVSKSII